jgi:hypothetical protein
MVHAHSIRPRRDKWGGTSKHKEGDPIQINEGNPATRSTIHVDQATQVDPRRRVVAIRRMTVELQRGPDLPRRLG